MGLISRVSSRTYRFEMTDLLPYSSPISPDDFGMWATVTVLLGFFLTASFFVYEVTSNKYTRDLKKEIMFGSLAAFFDGLAVLFVFLASGLYVYRFFTKLQINLHSG